MNGWNLKIKPLPGKRKDIDHKKTPRVSGSKFAWGITVKNKRDSGNQHDQHLRKQTNIIQEKQATLTNHGDPKERTLRFGEVFHLKTFSGSRATSGEARKVQRLTTHEYLTNSLAVSKDGCWKLILNMTSFLHTIFGCESCIQLEKTIRISFYIIIFTLNAILLSWYCIAFELIYFSHCCWLDRFGRITKTCTCKGSLQQLAKSKYCTCSKRFELLLCFLEFHHAEIYLKMLVLVRVKHSYIIYNLMFLIIAIISNKYVVSSSLFNQTCKIAKQSNSMNNKTSHSHQ